MKMILTLLLVAGLIPRIGSAEELDTERIKRIQQRFGKLVKVDDSQADGLPDLPADPSEEEEEGWSLFGQDDAPMANPTRMQPMQRRQMSRTAQSAQEKSTGWGWLHDEVTAEQEKRSAEMAAIEEAALQEESAFQSSAALSEEEIQREVALRLQQEPALLIPKDEAEKLNPLRQLPQYKALGQDYRSPAQQMLRPDYNRNRLTQLKMNTESQTSPTRFKTPTFPSTAQTSGLSTPYGQTPSSFNDLRKSSALPRASTLKLPEKSSSTSYTQQNRTIHDLRKLPSLDEEDPFAEKFPKVRRSIWED